MTTCLWKSYSLGLPQVHFVNCCQYMYLIVSLLILRAGCGIWSYQFLIIAYLFTLTLNFNLIIFNIKVSYLLRKTFSNTKCESINFMYMYAFPAAISAVWRCSANFLANNRKKEPISSLRPDPLACNLKREAKLLTAIGLTTKYAVCRIRSLQQ